jgi:hypothetical protein
LEKEHVNGRKSECVQTSRERGSERERERERVSKRERELAVAKSYMKATAGAVGVLGEVERIELLEARVLLGEVTGGHHDVSIGWRAELTRL